MKILFLVLLLLFSGSQPVSAQEPQDKADRIYFMAERLFLPGNLEDSLKTLNKFFALYGKVATGSTLAKAYNLRGLIYFQLRNLKQALMEFRRAAEVANKTFAEVDTELHLVRYNFANALFLNNHIKEANSIMVTIDPKTLDPDTLVRFYHLLGNTLYKLERYSAAFYSE